MNSNPLRALHSWLSDLLETKETYPMIIEIEDQRYVVAVTSCKLEHFNTFRDQKLERSEDELTVQADSIIEL